MPKNLEPKNFIARLYPGDRYYKPGCVMHVIHNADGTKKHTYIPAVYQVVSDEALVFHNNDNNLIIYNKLTGEPKKTQFTYYEGAQEKDGKLYILASISLGKGCKVSAYLDLDGNIISPIVAFWGEQYYSVSDRSLESVVAELEAKVEEAHVMENQVLNAAFDNIKSQTI